MVHWRLGYSVWNTNDKYVGSSLINNFYALSYPTNFITTVSLYDNDIEPNIAVSFDGKQNLM